MSFKNVRKIERQDCRAGAPPAKGEGAGEAPALQSIVIERNDAPVRGEDGEDYERESWRLGVVRIDDRGPRALTNACLEAKYG